jgi:hypothetical protein
MYTYTSQKGFFRTAGYKFKWCDDGYDVLGIGLNENQLTNKGEEIIIAVENKIYSLNTKEALEFIRSYHAFFKAGKGRKQTTLGVVSKSLMTIIN